jgi:hypothetical protein
MNIIKVISLHISMHLNMQSVARISFMPSCLTPKDIESSHNIINKGMGEKSSLARGNFWKPIGIKMARGEVEHAINNLGTTLRFHLGLCKFDWRVSSWQGKPSMLHYHCHNQRYINYYFKKLHRGLKHCEKNLDKTNKIVPYSTKQWVQWKEEIECQTREKNQVCD